MLAMWKRSIRSFMWTHKIWNQWGWGRREVLHWLGSEGRKGCFCSRLKRSRNGYAFVNSDQLSWLQMRSVFFEIGLTESTTLARIHLFTDHENHVHDGYNLCKCDPCLDALPCSLNSDYHWIRSSTSAWPKEHDRRRNYADDHLLWCFSDCAIYIITILFRFWDGMK